MEFCKLLPRDVCVFDRLILAISSCWLCLTPCTLPFMMSSWLVGGLSPATVPIPSIHPGAPGLIWRVATTSMPGAVEAAYPHHPLDPGLRRSRASSHPPRHISWGWQRSGTTWRVSCWVKSQLCLHRSHLQEGNCLLTLKTAGSALSFPPALSCYGDELL